MLAASEPQLTTLIELVRIAIRVRITIKVFFRILIDFSSYVPQGIRGEFRFRVNLTRAYEGIMEQL